MQYLDVSEYVSFGLGSETSDGLVRAASAMIDSFCRRPSLGLTEYVERLRVGRSQSVQLTYGPLDATTGSPLTGVRMRADMRSMQECNPLFIEGMVFNSGNDWVPVDVSTIDVSSNGVVTLPRFLMGVRAAEIEVTYQAGFADVPDTLKVACAQIVRNVQATPALTVRSHEIDGMRMEYFSATLLDADVQSLLTPYVAQRMG